MHRDIKPGNVLLADDGTAKITDFGVSHTVGDLTVTDTGILVGTPAYLAPEVAQGQRAGFAEEVFSLGATLYTALEGTPPFGLDDNAVALLDRVASGQIIPRGAALPSYRCCLHPHGWPCSGGVTEGVCQGGAEEAREFSLRVPARCLPSLSRQYGREGVSPARRAARPLTPGSRR
jgi:serine/threonine protein kinase